MERSKVGASQKFFHSSSRMTFHDEIRPHKMQKIVVEQLMSEKATKIKSRKTITTVNDELDIHVEFKTVKERKFTNLFIFREQCEDIH